MRAVLNGVEVAGGFRFVTATIEGVRYEIPEMWLIGACHTMEFDEALRHWHDQAQMAETATVLEFPKPSLVGKTLRRFSAAGPCLSYAYGVVVKYTDKTVTFKTERGQIKRAGGYDWHSNGTRPLGEGLLHTDPCPSCMDHPHTQYPNGYMD